jgi:hypothetical protein
MGHQVSRGIVGLAVLAALLAGPTAGVSGSPGSLPPGPAVQLVGAAGTYHGLEQLTTLPTGQTFGVRSVGGWSFPAGKAAGWTEFTDGKLFMAGQDQGLNALRPTGTSMTLSVFDPANRTLRNLVVPTTNGLTSVVGSNGQTGGAYGADVQALKVGAETWVIMLSSVPYVASNPWPIATDGLYPTLAVFRRVAGRWQYDASKSATAQDLHDSSPAGASAFPYKTNAFGERYADNLAVDELAATPVSKVLMAPYYFANPGQPYKGGGMVAIDPATKAVLAHYVFPFTPISEVAQIAPRSVMVSPIGTLGAEDVLVIFDCFDSAGADAGFNVLMLLRYDHTAGTFTPLSNWLRPGGGADHWTNGMFDGDGWLWLGQRAGLSVRPMAVFPRTDGSIKLAATPFVFDGTFAEVATPDFSVDLPSSETSYLNTRIRWDAKRSVAILNTANFSAIAIKREGDPHGPRLTRLPTADSEINTYLAPAETGTLFPMDAALDPASGKVYAPIAQLDDRSWPSSPIQLDQWIEVEDVARLASTPVFVGSEHGGSLAVSHITPALPTYESSTSPVWAPGDEAVAFLVSSLTSNDPAIAAPPGWTRVLEDSNGSGGIRYSVFSRTLAAGDRAPMFDLPRAANVAWGLEVYRGTGPGSAVDVSASVLQGGGTNLTRPGVTPTVAGTRLVGLYGAQGAQAWTVGSGEIERAAQEGILGGGLSLLMTEEETLGSIAPTSAQTVTDTSPSLGDAITVAIAPSKPPAPPPGVSGLTLSPASAPRGGSVTGTVTLGTPAPTQGTVVVVTSDSGVVVPFTVAIPAGQASADFTVVVSSTAPIGAHVIQARTVGPAASATLSIVA